MLTRTQLIQEVKTKEIETPRPAHMMKTDDLRNLFETVIDTAKEQKKQKKRKVDGQSMKDEILKLHKEGKSRKEIKQLLEEKNWGDKVRCGKVRPIYIYTVLKKFGPKKQEE